MASSKLKISIILALACLLSCTKDKSTDQESSIALEGTWQLISGTTIEKGDTVVTNYTAKQNMIKVINKTHFAFLNHDRNHGKDTAIFAAGGGSYELKGNQYTEYLTFCSDRQWEGNKFTFTVRVQSDTMTQSGIEKIEGTGVDRLNIEK